MTEPKTILVCLLLSWALFGGACLGPSARDITIRPNDSTQGSFGYRFEPDQQVVRGRDDEPTTLPGPDSETDPPPLDLAETDFPRESGGPSLAPVSPADDILGLEPPVEERVPGMTPPPYLEEWLSPPPRRGFFESEGRVIIMAVLVVIAVIASIGVLRNW